MLAAPRFAQCAQLNGLALCEQAGVFSSAPLAADERAATPPSSAGWCARRRRSRSALRRRRASIRRNGSIARHRPAGAAAAPGASPRPAPALLETTPVREIFSGKIAPPSGGAKSSCNNSTRSAMAAGRPARPRHGATVAAGRRPLGAVPLGLIGLFGARTRGGRRAALRGRVRPRRWRGG